MKLSKILAGFTMLLSLNSYATLTHQYQLNGNLNDDQGGAALLAHGGSLSATGYSFQANEGLTQLVDLGAVYTIDLSFHFDSFSGWQKIIDFSNLASDSGMYTLGNQYNFYPVGVSAGTPSIADGRLTLTRDAAGMLAIYENGNLIISFSDTNNFGNFTGHNANFFIDDFATSQREARSGYVDYIRTYDNALSANEVAGLGAPNNNVPEPTSIALLGLGMLGLFAVKRKNSVK